VNSIEFRFWHTAAINQGALCPQLARADISPKAADSGFDSKGIEDVRVQPAIRLQKGLWHHREIDYCAILSSLTDRMQFGQLKRRGFITRRP
jgi:hypothetical protein